MFNEIYSKVNKIHKIVAPHLNQGAVQNCYDSSLIKQHKHLLGNGVASKTFLEHILKIKEISFTLRCLVTFSSSKHHCSYS